MVCCEHERSFVIKSACECITRSRSVDSHLDRPERGHYAFQWTMSGSIATHFDRPGCYPFRLTQGPSPFRLTRSGSVATHVDAGASSTFCCAKLAMPTENASHSSSSKSKADSFSSVPSTSPASRSAHHWAGSTHTADRTQRASHQLPKLALHSAAPLH